MRQLLPFARARAAPSPERIVARPKARYERKHRKPRCRYREDERATSRSRTDDHLLFYYSLNPSDSSTYLGTMKRT
ncbi:MAG: hypothetical protein ACLU0V_05695, partial [Eggerthella lenta]